MFGALLAQPSGVQVCDASCGSNFTIFVAQQGMPRQVAVIETKGSQNLLNLQKTTKTIPKPSHAPKTSRGLEVFWMGLVFGGGVLGGFGDPVGFNSGSGTVCNVAPGGVTSVV